MGKKALRIPHIAFKMKTREEEVASKKNKEYAE